MQALMLRKLFASPVDDWSEVLEKNEKLLDTSFFQRVEARIRWSVDNGQVDDALRFALVGDTAGQVVDRKTNYRLQMSQLFRHRGNMALAADIINNILMTDPKNKEAKFYKASLMHDNGAPLDAYPIYEELYKDNVHKAECAYRMALIDIEKQDALLARKRLQEAIKIDPKHDLAKIELAKLEKFIENASFAPPTTSTSSVTDNSGVIPFSAPTKADKQLDTLLADAAFALASNEPNKAIELYQNAIAIDSSCVKAYTNMGAIYFQQGEYAQALAHFTKANQLSANDFEILRYLGYCHEAQYDASHDKRELAQANDLFKKSNSLNPNSELLQFDITRTEYKIKNAK